MKRRLKQDRFFHLQRTPLEQLYKSSPSIVYHLLQVERVGRVSALPRFHGVDISEANLLIKVPGCYIFGNLTSNITRKNVKLEMHS